MAYTSIYIHIYILYIFLGFSKANSPISGAQARRDIISFGIALEAVAMAAMWARALDLLEATRREISDSN